MDTLRQLTAVLVGVGSVCLVLFGLIYGLTELSMLILEVFQQ